MVEAIQNKIPSMVALMKKHKVKRAYALGSVVRADFNKDSDIDILIAFEDNLDPFEYGQHYFDLADQLEELPQRPVDLITEASLKNPYLIQNLNETKVPLYE